MMRNHKFNTWPLRNVQFSFAFGRVVTAACGVWCWRPDPGRAQLHDKPRGVTGKAPGAPMRIAFATGHEQAINGEPPPHCGTARSAEHPQAAN